MKLAFTVVTAYAVLSAWLFADTLSNGTYLAETDLYEYFLPIFLAPITTWSPYEYGGLPAFADPGDYAFYPPQLLARAVGSWTLMAISGHVLAASFAFAYVLRVTGSRTGAAVAGLGYALSEAMVERLAHIGIFHAIAWAPLVMLAMDRLRGERPGRWAAIGGIALACCFLAGHPQPMIYTAYCAFAYALVGGWAERAPRSYYAWVVATFTLGGLLAAIKALPFVQASFLMNRQGASFEQFIAFANSMPQMLSTVLPTVIHEGREAPTYVGLATLVFAIVGVTVRQQRWRVMFWLSVVVITMAVGMGDQLPVSRLVHMLPLQDNFRVGARHLFLAALGAAVLAGIGVAAVQAATVSRRRVLIAAAAVVLLVGVAISVVNRWPGLVELENRVEFAGFSRQRTALAIQMALALATAAAAALLAFTRGRIGGVPLMAVLVADLCYAAPDPLTRAGILRKTIEPALLMPSTHARELAAKMAGDRQRFINVHGASEDAVVPATFARHWRIPIAGGYGPMLLATHGRLLSMGSSGAVDIERLADEDTALDLLAVRYAAVKPAFFRDAAPFERHGVLWTAQPLEVSIGPSECGHLYERSVRFALPEGAGVAAVALVARLRCSEQVPQGTPVGSVRVFGSDGSAQEHVLRAGIDIADQSLREPGVLERAQHTPLAEFGTAEESAAGTPIRFDVTPVRASHVEVHGLPTRGWIVVNRMTVVDTAGRSHPVTLPAALLDNGSRWRVADRFRTSRLSDRLEDHDAAGEEEYVIYENRRALPRAWVASEIIPLRADEIVTAVHHGHLPDGRRFDPRTMALVESASGVAVGRFDVKGATAAVRHLGNESITVDVSAPAGGFLVLSDSHFPGWSAAVDGEPVTVIQTDYSLRGVLLPPGARRVEFTFNAGSQVAGAWLTGLGAVAAVGLTIAAPRRRTSPS